MMWTSGERECHEEKGLETQIYVFLQQREMTDLMCAIKVFYDHSSKRSFFSLEKFWDQAQTFFYDVKIVYAHEHGGGLITLWMGSTSLTFTTAD